MPVSMDTLLTTLVRRHSSCAFVLDRYRIDYTRDGHLTLLEACDRRRLDPGVVVFECETEVRRRQALLREPEAGSARHLLLTSIAHHHRYLYETLPLIDALATDVADALAHRQPILRVLARMVTELVGGAQAHIVREERDVFPVCLWGTVSSIRDRLPSVDHDHEELRRRVDAVRGMCSSYVPPERAPERQRVLWCELAYLDQRTRALLRLEDEILFPRLLAEAEGRSSLPIARVIR